MGSAADTTGLATALFVAEQFEASKDACSTVLRLKPSHFGCLSGLVQVGSAGTLGRSLAAARCSLRFGRGVIGGACCCGMRQVCLRIGDMPGALDAMRRLRAVDPACNLAPQNRPPRQPPAAPLACLSFSASAEP